MIVSDGATMSPDAAADVAAVADDGVGAPGDPQAANNAAMAVTATEDARGIVNGGKGFICIAAP